MRIEDDVKLDFDDVLIKPKRSVAASRASVSLKRIFNFPYSPHSVEAVPLLPANMDSTGSIDMGLAFLEQGALGCLHKFYKPHEYPILTMNRMFYSMGIQESEFDKLAEYNRIMRKLPLFICIDVANGYTKYFVDFVSRVRELSKDSIIMAGNVATAEMTQELVINGKADIIKVGIGPGSVCTTRLKTGVGYPQLSAIAECADVAHGLNAHICADGGCKNPGDVAKAFGAGADFVMLGGMLAGAEECEGKWEYNESRTKYRNDFYTNTWTDLDFRLGLHKTKNDDHIVDVIEDKDNRVVIVKYCRQIPESKFKKSLLFHGMSSREAMEQHSGGVADYKTPEGVEIRVPYKGPVKGILDDIMGGLRSTCAYVGVNSIKQLPKATTFVRVNRIKEQLFSVDYHGGNNHDKDTNCSSC
jgi:GMP reductase